MGGAWSVARRVLPYASLETAVRVHSAFEHGYTAGGGARLGAVIDATRSWRVHLFVQQIGSLLGERTDPGAIVVEQRLTLARATPRCASICAASARPGKASAPPGFSCSSTSERLPYATPFFLNHASIRFHPSSAASLR